MNAESRLRDLIAAELTFNPECSWLTIEERETLTGVDSWMVMLVSPSLTDVMTMKTMLLACSPVSRDDAIERALTTIAERGHLIVNTIER